MLPNLLSVSRLLLLLPMLVILLGQHKEWYGWLPLLFVMIALSDWLDGWVARRWQLQSAFGAVLDQIIDKMVVAGTLLALAYTGALTLPLIIAALLIILREIAVSGWREYCASQQQPIAVSQGGKVKTTLQLMGILILLLSLSPWPIVTSSLTDQLMLATALQKLAELLLGLAALLGIISAITYFRSKA